jgi:hypothetical protein
VLELFYSWMCSLTGESRVLQVSQHRAVEALKAWVPKLTPGVWLRSVRQLERNGALAIESEGRPGQSGSARYRLMAPAPVSLFLPDDIGMWHRRYEMRDEWPYALEGAKARRLTETEILRALAAGGPLTIWMDAHQLRERFTVAP